MSNPVQDRFLDFILSTDPRDWYTKTTRVTKIERTWTGGYNENQLPQPNRYKTTKSFTSSKYFSFSISSLLNEKSEVINMSLNCPSISDSTISTGYSLELKEIFEWILPVENQRIQAAIAQKEADEAIAKKNHYDKQLAMLEEMIAKANYL